eukprot:4592717-Alexandrium_andersonii.AAC.1
MHHADVAALAAASCAPCDLIRQGTGESLDAPAYPLTQHATPRTAQWRSTLVTQQFVRFAALRGTSQHQ